MTGFPHVQPRTQTIGNYTVTIPKIEQSGAPGRHAWVAIGVIEPGVTGAEPDYVLGYGPSPFDAHSDAVETARRLIHP
jgi:hypothetical protein